MKQHVHNLEEANVCVAQLTQLSSQLSAFFALKYNESEMIADDAYSIGLIRSALVNVSNSIGTLNYCVSRLDKPKFDLENVKPGAQNG